MSDPTVHSYYRSNIAPELVEAQARVFEHLEIPLRQWKDDSASHSDWIDRIFRDDSLDDVVMVADIDAFPLKRSGYERMVAEARAGQVTGLAQVANHKDPNRIYAGPMFLAASRATYRSVGSPSLGRSKVADVGQALTDSAMEKGVPVALTYPKFAISPRWALGSHGIFGIGCFYGDNEFFHLFESRHAQTQRLFCAVADGVIAGRHDWQSYLEIMEQTPPKAKKRRFLGLF